MESRPWLPSGAALAALLLLSIPVAADLVITREGGVLVVAGWEVEGDWARLYLDGGGVVMMRHLGIERIVEDRAPPPGETDELVAPAIELAFRDTDAVPQTPFGWLIYEASRRHGMSPRLVAAMVRVESGFDPEAVSPKGAVGLMQLMPATADRFGVTREHLFDPAHNLEAGVRYLAALSERYDDDLVKILAAYNAGEVSVDRYDGVPPFRETRGYLRRIFRLLSSG